MTAKTFRDLGVDDALCDALDAKGITHPFPIQELALPLALDGNDLIGQARTGTGKTLAFGLPLLQRLDPSRKVTQALVIVPTRELCVQVHEDLKVGAEKGLSTISVYGGTPYEAQIEALTTGVHVVVGTPGRLLDHLNRGNLDLSEVRTLVLDEADEMLDMGFLPDVERLIEGCNSERHSMLFSATMPTEIVKLARRYMSHPTFTRADTEQHETAPNVEQHFFTVHRMDKPRVLARILQSPNRGGAYVFVRTKHMADRLVDELEGLSIPAVAVHGDLRQQTREKNLDRFRDGRADVLVCTEVAARGIDVAGVTHVINYDCPDDEKMYLHRIGRTARAGQAGVAVTFAEFNEVDRLNVIRKAVGATETETKQIFSTSDELTELFDLPAERPWDHLAERGGSGGGRGRDSGAKGKADRGGKSDKGDRGAKSDRGDKGDRESKGDRGGKSAEVDGGRKSSDRSRDGGRDDRPKGKSDGRPKSRRSAETGGASAGSARRRDDRGAAQSDRATSSSKPEESSRASESSRTAGDDASRVRTRTRTRSRGQSPDRAADAGGDERETQPRRQRSPRREHTGSESRDRRDTRDAGGTTEPSQPRGGARKRTARTRGGSTADKGGSESSDRSGDADASDGGRSGGRGGSGRSSSNRGGSNRGGSNRGGSNRGGSNRGSGGGGRDDRDAPEVQPKGRQARGDGQPQLARRVQVDHLP